MGLLLFVLYYLKSRFLIADLKTEYYTFGIALLFIAVGLWAGKLFFGNSKKREQKPQPLDLHEYSKTYSLSQREQEVLQLIIQGKSNQEIADQLFVSLNTVKTHVSNLLSKTRQQRRTQLIIHFKSLD